MKKTVLFALILIAFFGCKKEKATGQPGKIKNDIQPVTAALMENAVLYEANIRQYSPEGTFNAFTTDIPKLKKMNVKVLWLMPVHEIGIKHRKAKENLPVEQVTDSLEKAKYLGNPYAVKDYRSLNKDFGTKEDFKKLIKTAHQNGMYVILDWVANHAAWDHSWITQHPDFYRHDAKGRMVSPFDWTDVAELDYSNPNLRKAMLEEMKYWLTTYNIDGFRCDVAAEVPTDFWNSARAELNKIKPVFLLAEAEKEELSQKAFDVQYGWEAHYIFNGIAQGKKTVKDWDKYVFKRDSLHLGNAVRMNFTSNHAENSWNGTEYERMGDAVEVFAAMTYMVPGMPLIYNGQEYDSDKRLKLFEKDTIAHSLSKMFNVYEKLGKLKIENEALNGGKNPGTYKRLATSSDDKILAFERGKNNKKIIFVANLSKENSSFSVTAEGTFTDYMAQQETTLAQGEILHFKPWEYKIWIVK